MKALAWLLVFSAIFEVFPFRPAAAQAVAIDTTAARQLATAWIQLAKTNGGPRGIGCGFAHYEGRDLVVDSVPTFVPAEQDSTLCKRTRANAIFVFLMADQSAQSVVLGVLGRVLERRPDLALIGAVHAVVPARGPTGWIPAPLIWAAWRGAPTREPEV